ncbi:TPA: tail fiber assembly protein [Serratia marcescens]|uniref:tail fiber assembly protein n=1 Tax=Serratia marcescens TaxID=615 RepID=UPI000D738F47|nr:tail fiber assembly protein [Serratia marcescens]AWQ48027.1 hypothetical protein B1A42_12075 [Serratia marcescens]
MKYLFDAKTNSFYPFLMRVDYENSGTWPINGVEVDEEIFNRYTGIPPEGKVRGVDNAGLPIWIDTPAPSINQLILEATRRRDLLMLDAANAIAPLQDAIDLNDSTADERSLLQKWKEYRVKLNRIDLGNAPKIDWPIAPR